MILDSAQSSFIVYPTPVYLTLTSILGLFALQASPSFVPLVLLLATLRLFIAVVISREHASLKIILAIACLAASTTIANIGTSLNAIPEVHTSTAVFSLFFLTCITSTLIIGALLVDATFRPSVHRMWSHFLFFPTVWSTALLIASAVSPLGYLATWTPALGVGAYSWLRPILGPSGIDWVVGAWAVVISELMGVWIMGSSHQTVAYEEEHLIPVFGEDTPEEPERPRRSLLLFYISVILCFGALPSYFRASLPIPVNSDFTVPLSVACALPFVEDSERKLSFEEYLLETQRITSLAKVILWPEGAIRFETEQAKQESIEKIALNAAGSVIGVSFEDHMNTTERSDKLRNGIMLIDKDGVVFEYFKRHLVPFVETNAMVSYSATPALFDYQLVTKRNSRGKATEFLPVSITASICLDFAHPSIFSSLARRPTLILAPARTWHPSIGSAMWEQARARAEEIGSAVLWCDGGAQGISGIGGHRLELGEILQVGLGSWTRTIGLEIEAGDKRTIYGFFGPWLSMALIWYAFGMERLMEWVILRIRGERGMEFGAGFGARLSRDVIERLREWRRGRQLDELNERASLL
ncbi:hypothetical protein EW145_g4155 [Phellinidium pouzarii]|uniref:CN hydrolase domain-containing protein n=1 Tax=Phellinidium pouzarii TaxID=167371 RepID=A0A4S4L6E5_9AGAM|nr:hypothetical protein EW145_g4155 [Phellinidium pouzarii]